MKTIKILLILILSTSFLYSKNNSDKNMKSGLELLLTQYDWTVFWKEFTISGHLQWCGIDPKDLSKGMFGVRAGLIEPLYLVDVTTKNNKVQSLNVQIGRERLDKSGKTRKEGGSYINIIKFPLMHQLFKNTNDNGVFAFEKGGLKITYLGAMDPKKWNDIMATSMIPERGIFFNLIGVLAGAGSCLANEALDLLSPSMKRGSTGKPLRDIIDSLYYSVGCVGNILPGTINSHPDPLLSSIATLMSVMSDVHSLKGAVNSANVSSSNSNGSLPSYSVGMPKHRVKSVLNGHTNDIYCAGVQNPIIPLTQYNIQLLYPTVKKATELGVSPVSYSFHAKDGSTNTIMYVINQRRDYAALAYQD